MRIRNKLLLGFLLVSLMAVAIGTILYQRLKEVVIPLQSDIPQGIEKMRELDSLDRQVQLMRYNSEVMFNCIQNYASSQNIWWKQRYFVFKTQLESALNEVVSTGSVELTEIFKQLKLYYGRIIEQQKEIMKSVDDRESIRAEELLKKREYWENKGQFENLIDAYFSQRGNQYAQALESSVVMIKIAAQKGNVILRNSLTLTLLWLSVVIAVSLLIGMLITDSIARPLELLTNFTRSVSQGNLFGEISIKSKDEVGTLALVFNKMLKDLAEYREKLIRNEKLAAMGKLAGIIGHEIRNPLAAIANSVYFLKMKLEKNPDEKILKHLNIMESEVANAETVIEDTLDFAREKEPVLQKTDVAAVLEKAISRKLIPENIQLEKNIPEDLPRVNIDSPQMMRVFYNLIWNAIQAMPSGGRLAINVTVETSKEEKILMVVSVVDSGSGISPENLEKIFEPLFTTKVKGTGLGLSVCQGIVKAHKGIIDVQSQVGKGTTFTVRLPTA